MIHSKLAYLVCLFGFVFVAGACSEGASASSDANDETMCEQYCEDLDSECASEAEQALQGGQPGCVRQCMSTGTSAERKCLATASSCDDVNACRGLD